MSSRCAAVVIAIVHVRVGNGISQQGTFVIANVAVSGILIGLHLASVSSMYKGVDMVRVVLALFAIALAAALARAQAACEPQWTSPFGYAGSLAPVAAVKWWDRDGPSGPQPRVLVMVSSSDNIFGTARLGSAAAWEPIADTWTSLAAPTTSLRRVDVDTANRLIVASATRVYALGTTGWTALGGEFNGQINEIAAIADGRILAVGAFTSVGGVVMERVAAWDGNAWQPMSSGVNNTVNAVIQLSDGSIFIGGEFTAAGVTQPRFIARWSTVAGGAWLPVSGGLNATVSQLVPLQSGGFLALGNFTLAGSVAVSRAARWNGSWSSVAGLANANTRVLPLGGGEHLVTTGSRFGSIWNETTFTSVTFPPGGVFVAARLGVDDIFVSGPFPPTPLDNSPDPIFADRIARLRSGRIDPIVSAGSPAGPVYAMAVDQQGHLIVGGDFVYAGTTIARRVARWDGSRWNALGAGFDARVRDLTVLSNGDIIAVGDFTGAPFGLSTYPHVARWNGSTWSRVGSPFTFSARYAVVELPSGEFAVGGSGQQPVAIWDGTSWTWLPSLMSSPFVKELAVSPDGTLYAGSEVSLHRFVGGVWETVLPSSLRGIVEHIEFLPSGHIIVGGYFTLNGTRTSSVLALTDTGWSPVGSLTAMYVNSLDVKSDGSIIAVGRAINTSNTAYRWDGVTWSPLGALTEAHVIQSLPGDDHYMGITGPVVVGNTGFRSILRWTQSPACACDSIDFNRNGTFPEPQDVIDYFDVLAGGTCSTGACSDLDFNNNGVYPEDADVIALLNVLAGGACP